MANDTIMYLKCSAVNCVAASHCRMARFWPALLIKEGRGRYPSYCACGLAMDQSFLILDVIWLILCTSDHAALTITKAPRTHVKTNWTPQVLVSGRAPHRYSYSQVRSIKRRVISWRGNTLMYAQEPWVSCLKRCQR